MLKSAKDTVDELMKKIEKNKPILKKGKGSVEIVYIVGELEYQVETIINTPYGIRAVISLHKKGEVINKSLVALYSSRNRTEFCNKCDSISPKKIEKHLLDLETELKGYLIKKEKREIEKKAYTMTELEKTQATNFLKTTNIFELIRDDLTALGLAGEETNKLMTYLIATSRKLDSPLSGIVKAQSASGKSQLVKTILSLMPPEEVMDLTRITENALYWIGSQDLKHKLISIMEKEGSSDADYPIRILQSEKKLKLLVPQKFDGDTIQSKELEVNGPCAFLETTVKTQMNFENQTRVFDLYVNETEAQTILIHQVQKESRTLEGMSKRVNRDEIIKRHQNAQRLLKQVKVIIPWATKIEFPAKWVRTRRDMAKFLDLITVVTFIRQFQKAIKKDSVVGEYIESDINDYIIAYDLAVEVLSHSLDELDLRARELFEHIIEMAEEMESKGISEITFTRRDILKHINKTGSKWYPQILQLYIKPLEDAEYLEIVTGGKGKTTTYKLPVSDEDGAIRKIPLIKGLTTPEELEEKLGF